MGLFNLTFPQFFALFATVSAGVVALYLLDRSRRKQVVPSLRFWQPAVRAAPVTRRRHVQQPLSLLLQLLSILLLLLAIAQPRFGGAESAPRDHVLLLETSAWMAARSPGARPAFPTLMDEARARAFAYVRSLPSTDRIMIVRADALSTPAGGFESDRNKLRDAISRSHAGSTALNLEQALEFARHMLAIGGGRAGEVAFAGSGRISEHDQLAADAAPPNLRVLPIADAAENLGLRKLGLRRSAEDSGLWEIFVSARNYGTRPTTATITLVFGGAPAGLRRRVLPPGAERETSFEYRTQANGLLEARLLPDDAFPADNRAVLELPEQRALNVVVYSNEPELLRPILSATPRVKARFRKLDEYAEPGSDVGLVILDRFRPQAPPAVDSVWIDPPSPGSPLAILRSVTGAQITSWNTTHPLGSGLRTRDARLESVKVFETSPQDIRIAEIDSGAVIAARPGKAKTVVMGFHPMHSPLRFELAAPLLFANILDWVSPGIFRRWEVNGGSVGAVSVALEAGQNPEDIRVLQADGTPLPFSVRNASLSFFSGAPGTVRVLTGNRESVYSLTIPELGLAKWEPPPGAKSGIPTATQAGQAPRELWYVLAVLGAFGLLVEWMIYGRLGARLIRSRTGAEVLALFKLRKAS